MQFKTIPLKYLFMFNTDIDSTVFSYRVGSHVFSIIELFDHRQMKKKGAENN